MPPSTQHLLDRILAFMRGEYVGGELQTSRYIDQSSDAFVVLSSDQKHIHSGEVFMVSGQADLNTDDTLDILFVSSPLVTTHLTFQIRATVETNLVLYEGTTVSDNGSAVSITNHNRQSINVPKTKAYSGPTVTDEGTQLLELHFGSGQQTGGHSMHDNEIILAKDTNYLLRVTSEANSNDIGFQSHWYELG